MSRERGPSTVQRQRLRPGLTRSFFPQAAQWAKVMDPLRELSQARRPQRPAESTKSTTIIWYVRDRGPSTDWRKWQERFIPKHSSDDKFAAGQPKQSNASANNNNLANSCRRVGYCGWRGFFTWK